MCPAAGAATVNFSLLTHSDNVHWLAQDTNSTGDYLVQTADDFYASTLYPDGSFSFNFMDRDGMGGGYATGVHPLTGTLEIDADLASGGNLTLGSLHFDGWAYGNATDQYLVKAGDPATGAAYGPCADGSPNNGSWEASAASNWNFSLTFDWYYDTPYGGFGTIDMIFDDYKWEGFLIPVGELTAAGMAATVLEDPLGYYAGDFEAWLLGEVAPRLPGDAKYLLFAQGEAVVTWSQTTSFETGTGILGETILAYTTAPEPATVAMLLAGAAWCIAARRARLARRSSRPRKRAVTPTHRGPCHGRERGRRLPPPARKPAPSTGSGRRLSEVEGA